MRRVFRVSLFSVVLFGVLGCSVHAGNEETDRIADTVAVAISYPRQTSAEGFARASLATAAGHDGRLVVLEVEELKAEELTDPIARLVWRVHLPGSESGWVRSEPVTACYDVVFNRYGNVGKPSRRRCPQDATPVVPDPIAPSPQPRIPDGADHAVEQVLQALASDITQEHVAALLRQALPAADSGGVAPSTLIEVRDGDVGISVSEGPGQSCLLGARVGRQVLVWRPALVQVQPGELACDPTTALGLQGTAPPH